MSGRRKTGETMTDRRKEVLYWVARGKSNKEIGAILGIHPNTIKNHVQKILLIYAVPSRINAVLRGLVRGDLDYEQLKKDFA